MIQGRYFDARSSAPLDATLQRDGAGRWQVHAAEVTLLLDPQQVRASDRIGSIPRRLHLPDGGEFETSDNDGMDALLGVGHRSHSRFVNALERRWGIAVAALAGVALACFFIVKFGLPALAGFAAERLPTGTDQLIGARTLEILDRTMLHPTRVHPYRQAQLQELFAHMTAPLNRDGHTYRLEFRSGAGLGPNAFALPSGIIVMTDDLVQLSKSDEELAAVLAHEIGHVQGRHALRMLIQGTGVSLLAIAVLGDIGSVSALAGAAPALIQAKHSRDFEREADSYARAWLKKEGIAVSRFDDILCRMTQIRGNKGGEPPAFLSSHPGTSDRVKCR
ncbi:MAG: M48 family metallopeptidase [Pseudomonadota bacterium]